MPDEPKEIEVTSELLILADGTLYAHNLSAEVAEVLKQIQTPPSPPTVPTKTETAPQSHE